MKNNYAITLKGLGSPIIIEASYYLISDGFISLFKDKGGLTAMFASFSADVVESIVEQKKFTEEEILAQIKG